MVFLDRIQTIDRRIMYLLLVLVIVFPMFVQFKLPMATTPEVRGVYAAVEDIKPGQIAVLSGDWGAGTIAESQPQTEAMMRHLFRRNIPFAILPFAPQTTTLMQQSAERIAKQESKKYGDDWVNWGWRAVPMMVLYKGMGKDIPGTIKEDYRGRPLAQFKSMRGIARLKDVGFMAHITPVGNIGILIAFVHEAYGVPVAYAPTAVMVAQGYDPLDAHQLVGMLPGMVGAAQYENLLRSPANGIRWSNSLSFSEILMILLIALANIGYFASRVQRGDRA